MGPEGRKEQCVACHRLEFQVLSMKAGFASVLHGIEKHHDGQLPIPGTGPEGIEVPMEIAGVSLVVLDLVTGSAQWPDLQ
jgi:hypothetical protein